MRKTVDLLDGAVLMTKRMEGTDGAEFPKHTASLESALVILEGSCTIAFPDAVHELRPGDTFLVPANVVHHVVGTPDFQAIHIMPKNIRFDFTV
ncbi:cupin domain-containing protein [Homoserinimonas sp. OAct 916]|uniref:cupin domain-containing protein n=1 Tax=Homoserinimonas sp. OAct 916 TaxID=2211450 RepID=UPI0013007148|nr:cupin domain-containing protein [Homoserinimonas sp. OAct 916]